MKRFEGRNSGRFFVWGVWMAAGSPLSAGDLCRADLDSLRAISAHPGSRPCGPFRYARIAGCVSDPIVYCVVPRGRWGRHAGQCHLLCPQPNTSVVGQDCILRRVYNPPGRHLHGAAQAECHSAAG